MGPLVGFADPKKPHHDADALAQKPSLAVQMVTLCVVVVPFIGLLTAIVLLWGRGFDGVQLGLMVAMYLVSGLGVTIGYHRLFTHRSFQTSPAMKVLLAISGSMAVQGPLLKWVAVHRQHHTHSDEPDDPHSPHLHGHGLAGMVSGLWHAHMGWLFAGEGPNLRRHVRDLASDRSLRIVDATFVLWAILGLVIPTVLGGLLTQSWTGALLGLLWGGLARVFVVHHVTWSINSVCHIWGAQPFDSHDHSRNNLIFGVLGLGEGWHNNHHAFPTSARHGLAWWQFDLSWLAIRFMERLGLVWNVRVPAATAMAQKRRETPAEPAVR